MRPTAAASHSDATSKIRNRRAISLLRLPHPFAGLWRRVGSYQGWQHAHAFPFAGRPLALNLDSALTASRPLAKTAPRPILWSLTQPSLDWIAMNIAQLFYAFLLTPHWKIVVTDLPIAGQIGGPQLAGRVLLKHLHRHRKFAPFRFADQQVHVFGHYHIASYVAPVPAPHPLQFILEGLSCLRGQQLSALIATESNEMQAALVLIAFGFRRHERIVPPPCRSKSRRDKGGATPISNRERGRHQPPSGRGSDQ